MMWILRQVVMRSVFGVAALVAYCLRPKNARDMRRN